LSRSIAEFIGWDHRCHPRKWRDELAVVCEVKYDGHRMSVWRDECDEFAAYGRKTHRENLWTKLFDCLVKEDIEKIAKFPRNTVLDGEIYIPNDHSSSVATSLAKGIPNVRFQPFACPFVAGVDCRPVSFQSRDDLLMSLGFDPPQELSEWPEDELSLQLLAEEANIEGFVLKQAHYRGWYKVKRVHTVDAIVLNCEAGKGKHRGRIGALHLALFDGDELVGIGKVGIGNDSMWRDQKPDECIGRCVEVAHEGLLRNGRLRFPRFVRWRDDKEPLECGPEQL
tara:strand:+ start:887 stop:1732 length:846 start_codon:yes stop_codon:yes gene_type:complete